MVEIKQFMSFNEPPTLEEFKECVDVCKKKNCVINLRYVMFDKDYSTMITEETDAEATFENIKTRTWVS